MKIQASFVQDGKWWVAWTDDIPGALTQGATLEEARENLIDAVRMIREPVDLSKLPKNKKGQSTANTSISPIPAALRRFQDILRLRIFSRARFAANSVSQTQSKRIAYIVWTF